MIEITAARSGAKPRYQDIRFSFLRRLGAAMSIGYAKYEKDKLPPGIKNYQKGDAQFALECIDHAVEHLYELKEQYLRSLNGLPAIQTDEDHLGHCAANLNMLDFFEEAGRFQPPGPVVVAARSAKRRR